MNANGLTGGPTSTIALQYIFLTDLYCLGPANECLYLLFRANENWHRNGTQPQWHRRTKLHGRTDVWVCFVFRCWAMWEMCNHELHTLNDSNEAFQMNDLDCTLCTRNGSKAMSWRFFVVQRVCWTTTLLTSNHLARKLNNIVDAKASYTSNSHTYFIVIIIACCDCDRIPQQAFFATKQNFKLMPKWFISCIVHDLKKKKSLNAILWERKTKLAAATACNPRKIPQKMFFLASKRR